MADIDDQVAGGNSASVVRRVARRRRRTLASQHEILKDRVDRFATGPYRVDFHSHEPNEPPHVHVDRDDQSAKFWLEPIALARNLGFSPAELRRVQRMLKDNETMLLEK